MPRNVGARQTGTAHDADSEDTVSHQPLNSGSYWILFPTLRSVHIEIAVKQLLADFL